MVSTTFCVLYQFKVVPGKEQEFKDGWSLLTRAIRDNHGGLGSRLHRSEDGLWVAYAQWPDKLCWERSQKSDFAAGEEAMGLMRGAIAERLPPVLLEPQIDLLVQCHAEPAN